MKKIYTKNDTNLMGWDEFGNILNNLVCRLQDYQDKNHIKFNLIVPILRSGGVPATVIANKLQIINFLPVQLKNNYLDTKKKEISSFSEILQDTSGDLSILICETNTCTGTSAKKVIKSIKEKYPISKIYYSTVAKVYGGPDSFNNVEKYFWGIQTNEFFKANKNEVKALSLRPGITIFPWETIKFELDIINS